jgi:hypothetical protein
MRFDPTYQAARTVAPAIETHFAYHLNSASADAEPLMPAPAASVIETLIDASFWASLRREEGYSPKISLALLPPEQAGGALVFAERLPLIPAVLTKLAPAVERPGIHLGVWYQGDALFIWGSTREIPVNCLVLEVIEPGLLVVKHRRLDGFGKFINVAILKGDQIRIVDERLVSLADYPPMLTSMLDFNLPAVWVDSVNVLVELAVSMRAHGRGGLLLVVPAGAPDWRESIIHPISYPLVPAFTGLSDLIHQDLNQVNPIEWRTALGQAVDEIGGLTAVDGATVLNDRYEVLAFGAKIGRAERSARVEQLLITEPTVDNEPVVVSPTQAGGTRHLAAAQFVFDQREALALVASQDGRFTLFAWSEPSGMVHAHRVDALLL